MATGTTTAAGSPTPTETVGPPLLLLGVGYLCVAVGLLQVGADGVGRHLLGYVVGAVVPILLVGIVRHTDLDRRRSPHYAGSTLLRPGLILLAVAALVVAALHVWPIATEWAS